LNNFSTCLGLPSKGLKIPGGFCIPLQQKKRQTC
jgi:hypothetical protein